MATGRYASYFDHSDTADVKVVIELAPRAVQLVIHVAQSDVKVVIEVAQRDENHARRQLQLHSNGWRRARAKELCGHSIILRGNSPVWQAQLERWQGAGEPKRITIIVEEGEEAAACKLIQCLYTDCLPDVETEADLCEYLGILMLADQYQVTAALSLCAQKLEMLKDLAVISWELAERVMELPPDYLDRPGLSCLLVKIQEKILQHVAAETSLPGIGLDLEVVMRNCTLEKALMALPLHKCAYLLSDDRCHVASENTVAAAVVRRVDRERSRSGDDGMELVQSPELRAQIMANVIRVPHLSPLFGLAMPTFASQLTTVMPSSVYALGRELGRLPADLLKDPMNVSWDPDMPSCWLSMHRPLSTFPALEFEWEASAAELIGKFVAGETGVLACSSRHFFAGMDWVVQMEASAVPNIGGSMLGLFISAQYPLLQEGPRHGARVKLSILAPDEKSSVHRQAILTAFAGKGMGWWDMFGPSMQKWDQSQMQQWTNANGCLTICVKVSDVM